MNQLDSRLHRRPAAIHRPDLHQLFVAGRGLDHQAAFEHRVRRRLLDEHVLAGLQAPHRGERVPVIGRGDHDRIDVLVVERAAQVLHEPGLERRHVLQPLVVDARRCQVGVRIAQRLDVDVVEPREAALQRVALAANADAREHDAVVGADNSVADLRRRAKARAQPVATDHRSGRGHAKPGIEVAPSQAGLIFRHGEPPRGSLAAFAVGGAER